MCIHILKEYSISLQVYNTFMKKSSYLFLWIYFLYFHSLVFLTLIWSDANLSYSILEMLMSVSFSFFDCVPCTCGIWCKTVLLHYFCWRNNFIFIHPASPVLSCIKSEIPHLSGIPCCLATGIVSVFILSSLSTEERCLLFFCLFG